MTIDTIPDYVKHIPYKFAVFFAIIVYLHDFNSFLSTLHFFFIPDSYITDSHIKYIIATFYLIGVYLVIAASYFLFHIFVLCRFTDYKYRTALFISSIFATFFGIVFCIEAYNATGSSQNTYTLVAMGSFALSYELYNNMEQSLQQRTTLEIND